MSNRPESDVSSGLNELESKLRELEQAFATLGHDLDATPALEPAPAAVLAVAPRPPAAAVPDDVQAQIDALVRSQERLTATMQALIEDVSRIVDGLGSDEPVAAPLAPAPPPASVWEPPPPPRLAPSPATSRAALVAAPLIPYDEPTPPPVARSVRDYAPNPAPRDAFAGLVVVDVGPLADRDALTTFCAALEQVPGASDVRVRDFEAGNATIEVNLDAPLALPGALRRIWPTPLTATDADAPAGRLVVVLEPPAGDG